MGGRITYIWTAQGWLYLAVVIDLFNRQVVGFAMGERMTRTLVMDALRIVWFRYHPAQGLIFHSGRGSQHASNDYRKPIAAFNMTSLMSRKGDCWDDTVTETLSGSLKVERFHGMRFARGACQVRGGGLDRLLQSSTTSFDAELYQSDGLRTEMACPAN